MSPTRHLFGRVAWTATVLTLLVITFGAYVRLSHAGLSCPDWPGCYGQALVPADADAIAAANAAFPERPVDVFRAWLEMIHRYLAAALGLLIIALAWLGWRDRHAPHGQVLLPAALVVLVVFQGLLGMLTVTLLLKPLVVTAHLLGGLATLSLLWLTVLRHRRGLAGPRGSEQRSTGPRPRRGRMPRRLAALAAMTVVLQIALGGWTSTNYAALACTDFPTCHGEWLPPLRVAEALKPWHGLDRSYEGGILDGPARVTIHFLHRAGALLTTVLVGLLAWRLMASRIPRLVTLGRLAVVALLLQLALGVGNVLLGLPLAVAVAHNGGAALLLLVVLTAWFEVATRPAIAAAARGPAPVSGPDDGRRLATTS